MIEYAVAVGSSRLAERLFGSSYEALAEAPARRVGDVLTEWASAPARRVLARAEVLLTGWDTPPLDASVLRHAPRLRRVIHAGGASDWLLPDGVADVEVSDLGHVNALPVAEYALAAIIFANNDAFRAQALYRERRAHIDREDEFVHAGNHARTVGVVSASRTGRALLGLLRAFPTLRVVVHDPTVPPEQLRALGAEPLGLAELMRRSDVVTVHAPVLPETVGLVDGELLALMRDGTTIVNTSRGVIVEPVALERELTAGRLNAILDVTDPEPLPADSPLFDLPNVFLTPHISGSMGTELRRMGDEAASELARYARRGTGSAALSGR